jgi:hypothetical protein
MMEPTGVTPGTQGMPASEAVLRLAASGNSEPVTPPADAPGGISTTEADGPNMRQPSFEDSAAILDNPLGDPQTRAQPPQRAPPQRAPPRPPTANIPPQRAPPARPSAVPEQSEPEPEPEPEPEQPEAQTQRLAAWGALHRSNSDHSTMQHMTAKQPDHRELSGTMETWTTSDVCDWLGAIGLPDGQREHSQTKFLQRGVDGAALMDFTPNTLRPLLTGAVQLGSVNAEAKAAEREELIACIIRTRVSRPFPSWNRSILTDIYLCHACSGQEILRTETAGQDSATTYVLGSTITDERGNLLEEGLRVEFKDIYARDDTGARTVDNDRFLKAIRGDLSRRNPRGSHALERPSTLVKTVTAFLNSGEGGSLFFGVADNGEVVGVPFAHGEAGRDARDKWTMEMSAALQFCEEAGGNNPTAMVFGVEPIDPGSQVEGPIWTRVCPAGGEATSDIDFYVVEVRVMPRAQWKTPKDCAAWLVKEGTASRGGHVEYVYYQRRPGETKKEATFFESESDKADAIHLCKYGKGRRIVHPDWLALLEQPTLARRLVANADLHQLLKGTHPDRSLRNPAKHSQLAKAVVKQYDVHVQKTARVDSLLQWLDLDADPFVRRPDPALNYGSDDLPLSYECVAAGAAVAVWRDCCPAEVADSAQALRASIGRLELELEVLPLITTREQVDAIKVLQAAGQLR